MNEIRWARKGEAAPQTEIWQLCFGDSIKYIDFYYTHRYREEETLLLLQDRRIAAMLTMRPVKVTTAAKQSYNAVMLYAIATHPDYQRQGLATQLMDFCHRHLKEKGINFSILVPAGPELANFYRKQGYREGFFSREARLSSIVINDLPVRESVRCTISGTCSGDYNRRRADLLTGRLYISYPEQEIIYQKKLSQQSKADIYAIDIVRNYEEIQGCAAVERISPEAVLIREILLPQEQISGTIKQLARLFPAREYIVRTPAFLEGHLGGSIRPFGMIKALNDSNREELLEEPGYLGLAFD